MSAELCTEFQALMDAWSEAIVADDPEAIGSFAEPDWVLIGETGAFPREEFLEAVAEGRISHQSMTHEVHGVRRYGDVVVLFSRGKNTGTYDGAEFTLDEWTTEVFVRRPNGWKCAVTHLTNATEGPQP